MQRRGISLYPILHEELPKKGDGVDNDDAKSVTSEATAAPSDMSSWLDDELAEMLCVSCAESTTFAQSQSEKGASVPFLRRCNICCSSLRCLTNTIAQEKGANDGQSATEARFKALGKDERRQWYLKQKRGHEKGQHREVNFVDSEVKDTHESKSGRRRYDEYIPYPIFHQRQSVAGVSQTDIDEKWRAMRLDKNVGREIVMIDGKNELCLQTFGGILVYHDEYEGVASSVNKKRKIESEARLEAVLEEQKVMVASHVSQHAMGGTVAGSHALPKDIAMIQDTVVAEDVMPDMRMRHILNRKSRSMEATQVELRAQAAVEKEFADPVKGRPKSKCIKSSTTEEPGQSMPFSSSS